MKHRRDQPGSSREIPHQMWLRFFNGDRHNVVLSLRHLCSYFVTTGCIKKLNKSEIALRLCKAPQCTKFFIKIGF